MATVSWQDNSRQLFFTHGGRCMEQGVSNLVKKEPLSKYANMVRFGATNR